MQWYATYEDVPQQLRKRLPRTMFAPAGDESEGVRRQLPRCLRIVHHDNDSGGFQ